MTAKITPKFQNQRADTISLADVQRLILADPSLPSSLRRDIASSLNTLGNAFGKMLEAIPASPAAIRDMLQRKSAAMVGISRGRWNNVRSHTCIALLHLRLIAFPAEETKGKREIEKGFPANLLPALERYLNIHRPRLLAQVCRNPAANRAEAPTRLWISQLGNPLSISNFCTHIGRHTEKRFGCP